MIEILFWVSVALLVYIYVGYPIMVWILSCVIARPVEKQDITPSVSIVISAYNEEKHIGETIENKLSLDYPKDRLEIIVVSDESTDQTDNIVKRYETLSECKVKLLRQIPRSGKTSALNMAIPQANGKIIVFSDANSIYGSDALRALVRNFSDARVGYVTGKMIYTKKDGSAVGDGCSGYMKYENFLRFYETRINSVVGVDGGIDAVRKALYITMRNDQLPDFVLPLAVVSNGYRAVYEPEALLKEEALTTANDEYNMRVRVSLRALWALYDMRTLFNPFKYGIFSWQLVSHKGLRYLAFIPLTIAILTNIVLLNLDNNSVYTITFVGQFVMYLIASAARVFEKMGIHSPISAFAYYFFLVNVASAHAFIKFSRGERKSIWKPRTG